MPFRIETDPVLRRALGTDGAEWARAYINLQTQREGDLRQIELAAWFNSAIAVGREKVSA